MHNGSALQLSDVHQKVICVNLCQDVNESDVLLNWVNCGVVVCKL